MATTTNATTDAKAPGGSLYQNTLVDERSETSSQKEAAAAPPAEAAATPAGGDADAVPMPGGLKFWSCFLSLCLLGLSSALEATITTVALPTIARSIDLGSSYVWVGNSFLLASCAIQPFMGQLADIFGRRWPIIAVTAFFVLGSGIAGGANNAAMLIGGRTVQGLGAGGILVFIDVIVSDLVPIQARAKFLGLVRMLGALGSAIGPIVGGAIANANWRWCFYLNLITGGLALVCLVLFLNIEHQESAQTTLKEKLARIDYFGTTLFMASIISLLLGLVMGGTVFAWRSANVIVPIVLGIVGWAAFHVYETFGNVKDPVVPTSLFSNRTSAGGFFLAFDGALLLYYLVWYLPVYFQALLNSTPLESGVKQLPLNLLLVPSGIVAGLMLSKTLKYKPLQLVGFALQALAIGLFTMLDANSSKAEWAIFQIIAAIGMGFVLTVVLPGIQVSLGKADVAKCTAMYAFFRSFGGIWGVTIPSIVFTNQINRFLPNIGDATVRSALADGGAYALAAMGYVSGLPEPTQGQVIGVYTAALKTVWQVGLAFALAGFLAVFIVKQLPMGPPPGAAAPKKPEAEKDNADAEKA